MFISLEGVDGSGKSSAAQLLADRLGFQFMSTPGDAYSPIRKSATINKYSSFHYYLSSCYYVAEQAKKCNIVCDRYIHSTIAYNWPFDFKYPDEPFTYFHELRKPDFSFLLCASEEIRCARMQERQRQGGQFSELDKNFDGQNKAQFIYKEFSDLIQIDTNKRNLEEVVEILVSRIKEGQ